MPRSGSCVFCEIVDGRAPVAHTGAMSNTPIPAVRVKPGEYFLAAETVQLGLRFDAEGDVYEVVGPPIRVGPGWMARVRMVAGPGPGGEHNALLHTGKRVNP